MEETAIVPAHCTHIRKTGANVPRTTAEMRFGWLE